MSSVIGNDKTLIGLVCLGAVILLVGCAKTSPRYEVVMQQNEEDKGAQQIFDSTFARHGGRKLKELTDVNVAIDGDWYYLITKIQPDVTDETYRQQSQERLLLSPSFYAAEYTGDAGTKQVYRTKTVTKVSYNKSETTNPVKLSAAALTADAFYMFALGPLALSETVRNWRRLEDGYVKGKSYYRINGELQPGIGLSDTDYITLWVEKETSLAYRIHITLDGHESTQGAHVDTSFLAYATLDGFVFPVHFFERVIGPVSIDAHEWWYTGIDINRGLFPEDVQINKWSAKASEAAKSFEVAR